MTIHYSLKTILITLAALSYSFTESHQKNQVLSDYAIAKNNISAKKLQLKSKYLASQNQEDKKAVFENSRLAFTASLTNEIIPFWVGTKWTFEGHTEIPNQGTVACGYFVSTTLNHAGLKINRFRMAQKSPEEEAKTIQPNKAIEKIKNITAEALEKHFIATKKDGLYFVGLDYHVGYILKEGKTISFIHSNYINSVGVMKENILTSKAFISTYYFIADITHNDELIKKWLLGEAVKTDN